MADREKSRLSQNEPDMHPISKAIFGWVGHRLSGRVIFWGLLVLSVALIAMDVLHQRHVEQDIESISGFYGIYGFVAFGFVVLMGRPLGWLLRRDENYYGDADDIDGDRP